MMIHTIDLKFLGIPGAIAAFLVPTENGAILIECGPHSTIDHLLAGIEKLGYGPKDIHTLLLTHIHFDHAGAAWWFAQQGSQVYVHPRGYKHLLDPERLYESARQIYLDEMDRLWGKMEGISAAQLNEVADREVLILDGVGVVAHHTPGHASHHIAWQIDDILFTGDVAGAKINAGPVVPPCPPPDINLAEWVDSINRMRELKPARLYLTHFGFVDACMPHLDELENRLHAYASWIRPFVNQEHDPAALVAEFTQSVEAELLSLGIDNDTLLAYRAANPPGMSVAGLLRYWKKHGLV